VTLVNGTLLHSPVKDLSRAVGLMKQHAHDLGVFLTEDPQGKKVPAYLELVADLLAKESEATIAELASLTKSVEHIKQVVSAQQSDAGTPSMTEEVWIQELIEDAVLVTLMPTDQERIEVQRDVEEVPAFAGDKHAILQILINLLSNAKYAVMGNEGARKKIRISARLKDGETGMRARIEVADNGVGIEPENLTRVFQHGFTTKPGGHGFGLHSSANAAGKMGGSLRACSAGRGCGTTFMLEIPATPLEESVSV
jgi:signal transduction histidine kinase